MTLISCQSLYTLNPKEDPEEYEEDEAEDGPVDYPMDGGDDGDDEDDGDSSGYDADIEYEDEEEEKEDEHLALADSAVVIPIDTSISLPPEAEVERILAMPTPSPSPLTSLSPPSVWEHYGFADIVEAEMRHRDIREVGYGFRDTWIDLAEAVFDMTSTTLDKVNTRVAELAELHEHDTQDLYALQEDAQDGDSMDRGGGGLCCPRGLGLIGRVKPDSTS
nr:hypothetical protein [Tanacetum cinerariifolium]